MTSIQNLSQNLEHYVWELNRAIQDWQHWLLELEAGSLRVSRENSTVDLSGAALFQSLNDLIHRREELISQANQLGAPAHSLYALAQCLPIWREVSFRKAFEGARIRLTQLRRDHMATWILLRQSTDYCQDALMLMMSGKTRRDYTIDQNPPEPGGHLLDASL